MRCEIIPRYRVWRQLELYYLITTGSHRWRVAQQSSQGNKVGEYVKYETEVMKSGPKYQNNEQQQNRRRNGVQRLSKALPKEKSDMSDTTEYKSKKGPYMDAGEYM